MKVTKHSRNTFMSWCQSVLGLSLMFFVAVEVVMAMLPISTPPLFLRERFATRICSTVPPLEVSIVNWQVANCIKQKHGNDILLLGDSSCLMGLMPKVIEKQTGLSCWNLGTLGYLGTEGHALLLDFWIRNFGPPRFLVYHVVPYTLVSSNEETHLYRDMLKEWLTSEGSSELCDRLPSGKARRYALNGLSQLTSKVKTTDAFFDSPRSVYPSDREVAKILLENQGWMPEYTSPKPPSQWQIESFKPFHSDCVPGLKHIFDTAQRYKIPVLVMMHDVPSVYTGAETTTAYRGYEHNLEICAERYANVHLQHPLLKFLPTELCANLHHPTPQGALIHTKRVSESINECLLHKSVATSKSEVISN
jgi:hypothetical protein